MKHEITFDWGKWSDINTWAVLWNGAEVGSVKLEKYGMRTKCVFECFDPGFSMEFHVKQSNEDEFTKSKNEKFFDDAMLMHMKDFIEVFYTGLEHFDKKEES